MAFNKIIFGTTVLVDLTGDTVAPDKLFKGVTAHDKSGKPIIGTYEPTAGIQLQSVAIKTSPTKTVYTEGEVFSTSGMTLTATYSNGATRVVSGPFSFDNSPLTTSQKSMTVSFTENGVTRSVSVAITVKAQVTLSSIAVKTLPTKTTYKLGEALTSAGMVVEGTYSDGSKKILTGWYTSPSEGTVCTKEGTLRVAVCYDITGGYLETSFNITVEAASTGVTGVFYLKDGSKTLTYHFTVGQKWIEFSETAEADDQFFTMGLYILYGGMYKYILKNGSDKNSKEEYTNVIIDGHTYTTL